MILSVGLGYVLLQVMVEKSVKCEHRQNLVLHIANARLGVVLASFTLMLGYVLSIQWIIHILAVRRLWQPGVEIESMVMCKQLTTALALTHVYLSVSL